VTESTPLPRAGAEHHPFADAPLTITDSVRYQGAAGDFNPMHHDMDLARAAGHPAPYAVGMRQASVLGAHVAGWPGIQNLRSLTVRFRGLAFPGDALCYRARVEGVESLPDGSARVTMRSTCDRGDTVVLEAQAEFLLGADAREPGGPS
jgi:acyl dehydratase